MASSGRILHILEAHSARLAGTSRQRLGGNHGAALGFVAVIPAATVRVVALGKVGRFGDAQVVLADLERLTRAFYTDDLNTILALTHPNVIKQMGEPAQAKSLLKNSLERIQASGVSIESCTFPESPKFAEGANHKSVVVPM